MFVDWFDAGTGVSRVPSVWHEMNALLNALERPAHTGAPRLDVQTDEEKLTLVLTAPGVRAEDIDVQVTGRRLDVSVTREPRAPEGFRTVRQERRAWRVERTFELPFDVLADQATAKLDAGVFTLVLPRVPKAEPVKIAVTAAPQIPAEEV
ncbi:MAG: Hsp20/alpha crystallin family protein [Alphaproteobacteria bacterium]|nr:Hsp20/alpha crystallin family protein [Alphaproteobacteria bacterium]